MKNYIGIWIDHTKAVIVFASAADVTTEVVKSEAEGHPRYSGGPSAGGEKKYEARHGDQLERYYDDVIRRIAEPDRLLIFGPGEAKIELKERLSRTRSQAAPAVQLETTDKLTDLQIVAKVKAHFSIAR